MTTKILSGIYNSGYVLKSVYSVVNIAASGKLLGGGGATGHAGYSVGGQGGMGGAALTLSTPASAVNHGLVTGGTGGVGGFSYYTGGQGGVGGAGVYLAGAAGLTNTSIISGGQGGAGGQGSSVEGAGGYGGTGVIDKEAGAVVNTGTILGGAGGFSNPGPGAPATRNLGGDGVDLAAGGRVTNSSAAGHTALIEGAVGIYAGPGGAATVTNFGTLDGTGGVAVDFRSAGDRLIVESGSRLIGAALGDGGTLELAGGVGTITGLGVTASLSGAASGQVSGFGAYLIGKGASWTLTGPSRLDSGEALDILNGGTAGVSGVVTNGGLIALMGAGLTTDLVVGAAGASLAGGGRVTLSNNAANAITGLTAAATLTNLNDTIAGAGQIGGGTMRLVNDKGGAIIGNGTTALVIDTGANAVANAGLIESVNTGGLTIAGAISNSGSLLVTKGTLRVGGAVTGAGVVKIGGGTADFAGAFGQNVTFTSTTGVLELAHAQTYAGRVSGLSKTGTSSLDLLDIAFTGGTTKASFTGTTTSGTLTVTDGSHTAKITLVGNYLGHTFTTSSDGHGGTTVVDPPAPGGGGHVTPLINAIAGFGAGGACLESAPPNHTTRLGLLAAPA